MLGDAGSPRPLGSVVPSGTMLQVNTAGLPRPEVPDDVDDQPLPQRAIGGRFVVVIIIVIMVVVLVANQFMTVDVHRGVVPPPYRSTGEEHTGKHYTSLHWLGFSRWSDAQVRPTREICGVCGARGGSSRSQRLLPNLEWHRKLSVARSLERMHNERVAEARPRAPLYEVIANQHRQLNE